MGSILAGIWCDKSTCGRYDIAGKKREKPAGLSDGVKYYCKDNKYLILLKIIKVYGS